MRLLVVLLCASVASADASLPPVAAREPAPIHWLTQDVPLTDVGAHGLASAEDDSCGALKPGSRWRRFDAYGVALGESTMIRAADCIADFGRGDGGTLYQSLPASLPRPTVRWTPNSRQRDAFWARNVPVGEWSDGDPLFFYSSGVRWAAAGGRRLAIARYNGSDPIFVYRGHAAHEKFVKSDRDHSFKVLAAVDLDGDGEPEVIVQHTEVDTWHGEVFRWDGSAWRLVATGVGSGFF
jgi:hypothetical protein